MMFKLVDSDRSCQILIGNPRKNALPLSKMKRLGLLLAVLSTLAIRVGAFTALEEGGRLLMENNPTEALPLLLEALDIEPQNDKIYLYLGILYEQIGQTEKSNTILQRGLGVSKAQKHLFYYNIGNNFSRQGDNRLAEDMYSQAISSDRDYADPYLNRGNTRLSLKDFEGALSDYVIYLKLKPESTQKTNVRRMIEALRGHLNEITVAENERKAREQALMNQVLNSLKNASEDATNLSSGTDKVRETEEREIDIEE